MVKYKVTYKGKNPQSKIKPNQSKIMNDLTKREIEVLRRYKYKVEKL